MGSGSIQKFHFAAALLADGWADDVLVAVGADGLIETIEHGAAPGGVGGESFKGFAIPGMANLHSHAFQRGFAGLAEAAGGAGAAFGRDDFWSWRKEMYGFAAALDPESMEAIAAQTYVEMLKGGYTAVGEFHYLHHAPDGTPYADRAEMSRSILRAAHTAGIGLTLLPTLYMTSGFGGGAPEGPQRRFACDRDLFLELLEALKPAFAAGEGAGRRLGVAFHSLRAVPPEALAEVLAALEGMEGLAPIHIHAAEQRKEVVECVAHLGARPVRWLLDNVGLGADWCLVHATHLDDAERRDLAACGAVAGLCPSTEANLGDGVFPAPEFLAEGGRIGIGSDSHISLSAAEELRLLEYAQRLTRERRGLLASPQEPHTGARLYRAAAAGGAQALGRGAAELAPGNAADIVVLDAGRPAFAAARGDQVLDAYVFAAGAGVVSDVIISGKPVIRAGRHAREEEVLAAYRRAVEAIVREGTGS